MTANLKKNTKKHYLRISVQSADSQVLMVNKGLSNTHFSIKFQIN